jgi:uncharacterized iron-regulated protein
MRPAGAGATAVLFAVLASAALAADLREDFNEAALARELARRPVVLLGEVHDNVEQHAVRAAALRRLLAGGARPAIAFEQFDRERQADIDRARREPPPGGRSAAEHVIEQGRAARGWDWALYRPFVELALEFDLPIVAANLSRADAMRVSREGFAAVFDEATRARFALDALPLAMLAAHEQAIDDGHCRRLPPEALPTLARAQIARDLVLAQAIRPHLARGVVLLTGNGHARNDIGAPFFLAGDERARVLTVGLLERGSSSSLEWVARFDVAFASAPQPREDPCASIPDRRAGDAARPAAEAGR